MAYNSVPAKSTGDLWAAADHNTYLKDNFMWFATYKGCLLWKSALQTIPNVTVTPISFDTEMHDTDALHAPAEPTKITIPFTGYYHVYGTILYDANATGYRGLYIVLDGVGAIAEHVIPGFVASVHSLNVEVTYKFTAGQIVYLKTYQSSGIPLNISSEGGTPLFGVDYIGQ